MNKVEMVAEAHDALQQSIHNWGKILIATGGTLKPAKCFYHLIPFSWQPDGTWRYDSNKNVPDLSIKVPLEDGTYAAIEHLSADTPTKTLGQMTCPMGGSEGAIAQMQQKAQGWLTKASASKLNKCNISFLLDKQFWPAVSFEISSVCAPFATLEDCLMKFYYNLLPICGYTETTGVGILWSRVTASGSRMFYWAARQATNKLWQQLRPWCAHAGFNGSLYYRGGSINAATFRTLFPIQQMGHPLLAKITLGKGGEVQLSCGNSSSSPTTPTGERLLADAGTRRSWIQ